MSESMTEKSGPPAPAAAPPSQRPEVDLSDLQAEIDSKQSQADEDEIFDDIAGKSKDDGDDELDADDEDDADAADESDETDEGKDEEKDDDADAEGKPRKRSRA